MDPRILLIDDDRLQHRLAQAHFRNFQNAVYELDYADTYDEGLERLLSGDYDACLLDYQLGPNDGLQLIREAVGRGCRTPIVFLTAESSAKVDIQAMEAGALDYLVKGEMTPRMLERSLRYALKLGASLKALHRLATRDELTGLLNRREFDRLLLEEIERSRRFGQPVGVVMIDVDRFKSVNDRFGHPAGDRVLKEIALRLTQTVRSVDRVARFGGEEFALILVQTDAPAARDLADRVCAAIRGQPIPLDDDPAHPNRISVTASAGIAALPSDGCDSASLIAAADRALYAAKDGGRDRAVAHSELRGKA